ncbi:Molybdopterin oxidoreductase, iron-sulfur binding subunit [hydrothermal vent metagenome]|uniref:Molybdopterin oxidoreductase, iron-sulfur binding subunit n=1 Tax=hydrothermal vent metagenome TaxID=652676 RepID=A0A3B1B9E7_9ZZZZ
MKSFNYKRHNDYKWVMVIDLDRCNGCGACVIGCQAENNIPVVGEKLALQKRTMSWLRIERYFDGEWPNLRVAFLPMPCQQCDSAPCEPVCPVFATYQNPEGLNAMIYNRCIGTRFCGNNCPYGVRKFNWFDYKLESPLEEQLNPDVSVRSKGVMEKCTFCIQRIRRGKDTAKDENRKVRDGDIMPACAQSCPTNAIMFGNVNDPHSKVAEMAESKRRLLLLEEHGTHPSVIYLKGGI